MTRDNLEAIRRRVAAASEHDEFQKSIGQSQPDRDRAYLLRLVDAFLREAVIEQSPTRFTQVVGDHRGGFPTREAAEAAVIESVTNG